jgi:hypothetical protein
MHDTAQIFPLLQCNGGPKVERKQRDVLPEHVVLGLLVQLG